MAWAKNGTPNTLGSAGDTLTISDQTSTKFNQTMTQVFHSGTYTGISYRLGNSTVDTGSNYASRFSYNGATDGTAVSQTTMRCPPEFTNTDYNTFNVSYFSNYASKEKLQISHSVGPTSTAGATVAPDRGEHVNKWANTSNAIDVIEVYNQFAGSGDFNTGSELVVLGYDPLDEHTNNFWEELASANGDGTASFDTGTFTSKKYLWIQAFIKRSSDSTNTLFRVGNSTLDTGSNYAWRKSSDGGADSTGTSQSSVVCRTGGGTDNTEFYNIFIINNTSNEKLIIMHLANKNTSGAATAPLRSEIVAKWTNTSNQIDIVGFNSGGANTLSSTSIVKVWGAN